MQLLLLSILKVTSCALMLEIGRNSCAAPCIGIGSGTATLNLYVHSPLLSFSLS